MWILSVSKGESRLILTECVLVLFELVLMTESCRIEGSRVGFNPKSKRFCLDLVVYERIENLSHVMFRLCFELICAGGADQLIILCEAQRP